LQIPPAERKTLNQSLLLGIDGGGTATRAALAIANPEGLPIVVGRGSAGPGNFKSVGFEAAAGSVLTAIREAFTSAGRVPQRVAAACIALAGTGAREDRTLFEQWAANQSLADKVLLVHDALPVLAAGTTDVCGVALISGTGSMAFGQDGNGNTARAGGWGSLFGDEGSGYALALAGLRATAWAADGRGPPTTLTDAFLQRIGIAEPTQLATLYQPSWDRRRLAGLATIVTEEAVKGDATANRLVDSAGHDLAAMIRSVTQRLRFAVDPVICATGGLILHSPGLQESLTRALADSGWLDPSLVLVSEPVLGAVRLAQKAAR
jgi:N-acetylglucosamine kinase-like BadF-type ATPase